MKCPQCGQEAVGMARACPSCGFMLPFSLRDHRQLRDNPPETTRLVRPPRNGPPASAPATPRSVSSPAPHSPPPQGSWPSSPSSGQGTPSDTQLPDWLMPAVPGAGGGNGLPPATWTPLGVQHNGQHGGTWMRTGAPDPTADPDQWAVSSAGDFASSDLNAATSRPAPLDVGTLLKTSRYRLIEHYGATSLAGQQSDTDPPLFLASDAERPGQRVLVQELPLAELNVAIGEQVQRRVTATLEMYTQHPSLPRLADTFSERRRRFLVFEMPDGLPFPDWRDAAGALSEPVVVRIAAHLLDGLAQAEQSAPPLVHGNIAPDNIIIGSDGVPVLIGYSAALLVQNAGSGQSGDAGGAYGFAAPEQLSGKADMRTDVFSLAAVLHWAITGREPREAIGGAVESARRINHEVTDLFDGWLAKALQPDPARRFQSAAEMRHALAMVQEPGFDLPGAAPKAKSGREKQRGKPAKPAQAPTGQKPSKDKKASKKQKPLKGAEATIAMPPPAPMPRIVEPPPPPMPKSNAVAHGRDIERTKTRTMLPGAAGQLRAAFNAHPPRRGGKVRRPRPFLRFIFTLVVLAGAVADGYFYLVNVHSPLLRLLPPLPGVPFIHL